MLYCTKCGRKNSDESKYCEACGAALRETSGRPGAAPTKTGYGLAGIGLAGGILAVIGFFTPWMTLQTEGVSTWDMMTGATVEGWQAPPTEFSYLAMFGAVLTFGGALCCLAAPANKVTWLVLATGGILAILAVILGFEFVGVGRTLGAQCGFGFGILLTFVGGLLGLVGFLRVLKVFRA